MSEFSSSKAPFLRIPPWARILGYSLIVLAVSLVYLAVSHFLLTTPDMETPNTLWLLWLGTLQLGLFLLTVIVIRRCLLRLPVLTALAMPPNIRKIFGLVPAFGGGVVLAVVTVLFLLVLNGIAIEAGTAGWGIVLELVVLAVFALFEELVFRGLLWSWLANRWGSWTALAVTSLLFALFHIDAYYTNGLALINICLAGILLSLFRFRTGNIWMAWGWHWGWNAALAIGFGDYLSGAVCFSQQFSRIIPKGAVLLNGGGFGVEGALPATIVLGLTCILLIFLDRREREKRPGYI